ncbi:phospholipase A and acyltransferase 3-like isoform X2 [Cololabis saira]|uniref:phospholipase A and acyltransferase 3-like isoform X2 n=1 Tax=Cololabis saira TaxID=129043 RepID=UPI002AD37733|nr:phospholipase A and acyltransferase 3-like isoform X2 [Cololabis saira]
MCFLSDLWASIKNFLGLASPGDLIEIFRGAYNHWAVYVGDGYVVHFVTPGLGSGSSGVGGGDVGIVLKQKLQDVVGKDDWKINNILDDKYSPRPAKDILRSAGSLVRTSLQYSLLHYNCEHFATEMRYGRPESQQAQKAAETARGAALVVGAFGVVGALLLRAMRD